MFRFLLPRSHQENIWVCRCINADSLCASPSHSELSEVLDLLSDNLDPSFIGGIELQHPLSEQLRAGGGQDAYKREIR